MARYVFGFLAVLLLAFLGAVTFARFDMRGGGEVPVVRGPEFDPDPVDIHPPDLIVTDSEGQVALTPFTYCWEEGNVGVCSESEVPTPGSESAFTSTVDQPVHLDFQIPWDVTATVSSEVGCADFELTPGNVSEMTLDSLGPAGDYVLSISVRNDKGDASWAIRVHNEIDAPCGGEGI